MDVMVLQDDILLNELIRSKLGRLGLAVTITDKLDEAIQTLNEIVPPLIISDKIQLLHSIAAANPISCSFILIANDDEKNKISEALNLGALDFTFRIFDNEFFEKSLMWIEVGRSLRNLSFSKVQPKKQLKIIERFRNSSELQGVI